MALPYKLVQQQVGLLCVPLRVGFKRLYAALFILRREQPFFTMNALPKVF